ncbi:MAG TPA: 2'-5' RNA ligase family protein [Candidatus Saccharimonadales bacterium]|nr:2'-5' RNA ligase family protein [Candidatus Saccharimonadales bacterium]
MENRYFIAFSLPDDVGRIITDAQNELLDGYLVMQPFQPHITLVPPNVLDKIPPESILPDLKSVAGKFLPLRIKLSGFGMFENRVLYITATGPKLADLQNSLIQTLPYEAQSKSNRGFIPHITLAQAKPKQELSGELIHKLKDIIGPSLPLVFETKNISKFKWLRPRTYEDKVI